MRIVFIGPPGAGKGTQAERVAAMYGLAHLSTGEMMRAACEAKSPVGIKAGKYMSCGQLVPDDLIIDVIRERLEERDCQKGYLLDGFPRTIGQAEALDHMLDERHCPLSVVLELSVNEEELYRRLAARGRSDDQPEVISQRLVGYHRQTEPLLEYYGAKGMLRTIDGSGTIDRVFSQTRAVLAPFA